MESGTGRIKKPLITSLRKNKDDDEQFNILGVTPEFQNYIAKHLSIILDKKLERVTKSKFTNQKYLKSNTAGGIKLFSSSTIFIEDSVAEFNVKRACFKKQQKNFQKLIVDKDDFKNLAVSAEQILLKEDLKYWSNRSKGQVFSYKKNKNGQLMLVE